MIMKKLFTLFFTLFAATVFAQKIDVTLYNILSGKFRQKSVYGIRSMNDGESYSTLSRGSVVVKFAYKTGQVIDTIANLDHYVEDYEFSSNEKKIL